MVGSRGLTALHSWRPQQKCFAIQKLFHSKRTVTAKVLKQTRIWHSICLRNINNLIELGQKKTYGRECQLEH
jgi:hypothetical protein